MTTRSLLIKSQLIISAICGGNSQHTKAGDSSEFYYLTVLYCTPPNCNVICSMYIPCLLLKKNYLKSWLLTNSAGPPPPSTELALKYWIFVYPFFFILMDSIHFKTDFSMNKKCFFCHHFLQSPTIYSLKTVQNLLSFEAFNDGMYSTNMVYFDCSPGNPAT